MAEWQAANLAPVRAAARGKKPNLLGGIARCAGCRYVLAPGKSRWGGTGQNVLGYRCRGTHTAGACTEPASVNALKLETHVEALWRQQMAHETVSVADDTLALQSAAEELAAAEEELAAFATDVTARRLLGTGYHAALEERTTAVSRAQADLQKASAVIASGEAVESYNELPVADRKRILGSSIDAVIVKRAHARVPIEERVTILWRGEGPEDLPRRGRDNGPVRPFMG
jgi:hypothetical protein